MIGVLIVDDDTFTRTTLTSLVREIEPLSTVQAVGTVIDAMRTAHEWRPDLAIVDLDLGEGPTGIDLAYGLRRLDSSIALLILTSYEHPNHAGPSQHLPEGCAYLVKGQLDNLSVLASAMARARTGEAATGNIESTPGLSEGQWTLMRLVAAGYTNAEVANRTNMSEVAVNKAITRLVQSLKIDVGGKGNVRVLVAREYFRRTGTISERR